MSENEFMDVKKGFKEAVVLPSKVRMVVMKEHTNRRTALSQKNPQKIKLKNSLNCSIILMLATVRQILNMKLSYLLRFAWW